MTGAKSRQHWTATHLGALPPAAARTLAALLHVYARNGRATQRDVAEAAGKSLGVTWRQLRNLEQLGLVAQDGKGTLRPLVHPVGIRR